MKEAVKQLLLGSERKVRRIPLGLYAGLNLLIDPNGEFGIWIGLFERETAGWFREKAKTARSFIDVGAGNGELSVWALRQPSMKKVLAYEPKRDAWDAVAINLEANGLTADERFEAHETFFLGADSPGAEELLGELPQPVIVKIDVDGAEAEILRRMQHQMSRQNIFFLVETHSEQLDCECRVIFEKAGYTVKSLPPRWWRKFWPEKRVGFNQWLAAEKDQSGGPSRG